jgi:hypothetical protein
MIKLMPLLTEMSQAQKELKKDYLFKQTYMKSSNTVPSWTEMWKHLKHTDGYKHTFEMYISGPYYDSSGKRDTHSVEEIIEDEQKERYFDIVEEYKHMDREPCWRVMTLNKEVNPATLPQLGIYWAVEERAAGAHWGHPSQNTEFVIYKGKIDLDVVDWPGTIFARMDMDLGDEEAEIRFLKNSKLFIENVSVGHRWKDEKFTSINDYRRL